MCVCFFFVRISKAAETVEFGFFNPLLHFFKILFGFSRGDGSGGSIFPAVWSAQLAARAEGVGSALTSVLGIYHGPEVLSILGVPDGKGWQMACCVSFGYPAGRWGVAARHPVHEVAYRNTWGGDLGLHIPAPLWPSDPPTP